MLFLQVDKRPISKHPIENKPLNAIGFLNITLACSKHTINTNCYVINPNGEVSKHYKLHGYRHIGVPQIGNMGVPEINFYKPN